MWQIEFQASYGDLNSLVAAFDEDRIQSVSWKEEKPVESWAITIVFEDKPDIKYWEAYLYRYCTALGIELPKLHLLPVPDRDWLKENQKIFAPFHVGQFFIYGSNFDGNIHENQYPLKIDAATAFGSGQHETTKGCLLSMLSLKNELQITPEHIMDLGCGSGILAMAAARLWGEGVIAVDNDPEAVTVATENVNQNGLSQKVKVELADAEHLAIHNYDLIVANILAEPLKKMAAQITKMSSSSCFLILSGLLNEQAQEVIVAYQSQKWTLYQHNTLGDWSTLVFRN